jgi:Na+/H+-dicarboxylate symporter
MFAGIILGMILGNVRPLLANQLAQKLNWLTYKTLKAFTYVIPIFVMGFVVKLQCDDVIHMIMQDYAVIFSLIALAQFGYVFLAYAALNHFNMGEAFQCIKNILPAAIAGFSSMSSAAVMPLTIAGAEQNAKNPNLVRSIIPSTANIHLMGDCFAIPILAFALMKSFGMPAPTLITYLVFTCYFVVAKFSVAAIPGGGIVVMIPILESCLGFNSEMISLITALYILFDPVITCANVLGNGAFAKLIDKLMRLKVRKVAFST